MRVGLDTKIALATLNLPLAKSSGRLLNKIDEETDAIENRAAFCREHAFLREAEYLAEKVSTRSRIVVSICNSLGKYF